MTTGNYLYKTADGSPDGGGKDVNNLFGDADDISSDEDNKATVASDGDDDDEGLFGFLSVFLY